MPDGNFFATYFQEYNKSFFTFINDNFNKTYNTYWVQENISIYFLHKQLVS